MDTNHLASYRSHQHRIRRRLPSPARVNRAADRADEPQENLEDWHALFRLAVVMILTGIAIAAMRWLLQHSV